MKSNDVRRGIASRNVRSGGADIGRVSKMRGPNAGEIETVRRRSSRGSRSSPARQRMIKLWSIGLGVGAFAIVVTAFSFWLRSNIGSPVAPATGVGSEEHEQKVKVASKFPSPSRDEALALVKSALANRDLARVAELFRTGTATPAQILDYSAAAETRDGSVESFDWMSSLDSDGLLIEGVVVNYKGIEKPVQRLALLTPDDRGRWLLDFEAFARTVAPLWPEILAGSSDQARIRVIAAPGVYYNGEFKDEATWASYSLTSPDMDATLFGYCRNGSPEARAMRKLFVDGTASTRVTLDIRRIKGGETRQFEISRVIAREWVVPDGAEKN
jgi:hypothetical protein